MDVLSGIGLGGIVSEDSGDAGLPGLSTPEVLRYSRHLILPGVGMEGQRKLKAAKVLLVGTGGLGSPLALYLAAAGVGTLGLVDFDVVDETNLQRQVVHGTKDVGRPKIDSAADRVADVNPHVNVVKHETQLTSENALEILAPYDVVIDGTDNFPTRYLVNDACVLLGKPNVYGSIFRFDGQLSVFWAAKGPCYRCLFREPPPPGLVPSCAEGGVLGVLPGIIGTMQALEAIKLIVGVGEPMIGRLMLFDALAMRSRELRLRKDPECPVCGEHPTVTELIDYVQFCGGVAGEHDPPVPLVSAPDLLGRLSSGDAVTLVDVREPHEWEIANLAEHGARLIPLADLPARMGELDPAGEIVVHCKAGGRSAQAVRQLIGAGFSNVRSLDGGITAWSEHVDPFKPRY
ncbi:MAG TPA: molybdopterin-synthase adenylyltransferase MoeB [Longimicrobiaceae bacterium]|jgi:adenylyltransferase/sulfurtransferase|nr:molybdopterin-synthase adenylyltransferase MoeB [Longimicrobiaceae bacterium]